MMTTAPFRTLTTVNKTEVMYSKENFIKAVQHMYRMDGRPEDNMPTTANECDQYVLTCGNGISVSEVNILDIHISRNNVVTDIMPEYEIQYLVNRIAGTIKYGLPAVYHNDANDWANELAAGLYWGKRSKLQVEYIKIHYGSLVKQWETKYGVSLF